ncbi:transposase [Alteromonas stellipolaris]|uniref:transposase n=1 Tax=Alteromonas stellipolaris TaxID=233316 RepID=UPI003F691AE5
MVPSEHSNGGKRHLGAITKYGNGRARRLLIEVAHSYRYPTNISTDIQLRRTKKVADIWVSKLLKEGDINFERSYLWP